MSPKRSISLLICLAIMCGLGFADEPQLKNKSLISPILLVSGVVTGITGTIFAVNAFNIQTTDPSGYGTQLGVGGGLLGGAIILTYLGFTLGDGQMDYSLVAPKTSGTSFEIGAGYFGVHFKP